MSTGTSVPGPRVSGMDVSDSALLATLLREAPIAFAFFGSDLRFRRVNQTLARWQGIDQSEHIGRTPSEIWPGPLADRAESAVRQVLAEDQPLLESDQAVTFPVPAPDGAAAPARDGQDPAAAAPPSRPQEPARPAPPARPRAASSSGTGRSPGSPPTTRTATSPASR